MRYDTALAFHQAEVERIQNKLAAFLSPFEAREVAMRVYDLALDVDQDIHRILQDPLAEKLYEYDGQFFTPRSTSGFHTAFDGLHVLKSLGSWIDTIFMGRPKCSAIKWLLHELDTHRWVAKRRRTNWEELGTLGLIPEERIKEVIRQQEYGARMGLNPPPLSAEEQAFFTFFEEQLERSDL